jgi:hypothetical protein
MNTADSAPSDRPILVWVRDANRDGTGAWKPGRVWKGDGLPATLAADGYNGNGWDVPTWTEYPEKPVGEK